MNKINIDLVNEITVIKNEYKLYKKSFLEENLDSNNLIKIDNLNKIIYEQKTLKEKYEAEVNNLQIIIDDLTYNLKISNQNNYNEIINYKSIISDKVKIIEELEITDNKIKDDNLLNYYIKK